MTPPAQHGSCARYERDGCRCELCRTRHNERVRANRKARLESGRLNHGSRSAYDAGCRCADCKRARRNAYPVDKRSRTLRTRKEQQQS